MNDNLSFRRCAIAKQSKKHRRKQGSRRRHTRTGKESQNYEENRKATIGKIEELLPFIQKDTELVKIVTATIEKMKRMPDEQFAQLDLEPYRQGDEDE